jgi:hypothetical protein
MKPAAIFGILLIVFGLVALAYQGFTYTRREKVIDLGPIQATAERQRTVPLPPIVGIVAVAAGVALVVAGVRKGAWGKRAASDDFPRLAIFATPHQRTPQQPDRPLRIGAPHFILAKPHPLMRFAGCGPKRPE